MLDVTLALMIRHRLPIDAKSVEHIVITSQTQTGSDLAAWSRSCAEHISHVSRATQQKAQTS